MKRITLLLASAILTATVTAGTAATTQKWTLGWDNFGEPLNLTKSNIQWSVSSTRKLTVTYRLVSARPSKLYQVSINFFCSTFPATFGQFPTDGGGGVMPATHATGRDQRLRRDRSRRGHDRHPWQRFVHGNHWPGATRNL